MEVNHIMYIVKCINPECDNKIRLSEGKFVGGINDKGGIVIECEKCGAKFPCKLKNPNDASGILQGGKILDTWLDEFPEYLEKKHQIKKADILNIERLMVFNYEKPPKIKWSFSEIPTYAIEETNLEKIAYDFLEKNKDNINDKYQAFYNYYVKGKCNIDKSFIILKYEYLGKSYEAIFAKEIENENNLNTDNLYLIHHTNVDFENQVDGIFSKTQCLFFLERFLNRWKYLANEVLLVVPFIGYHYPNQQDALTELWNWLEINIDVNKTNLVTRKGTFNLFKKAQDNTGIPYELLVEWGLLEPLIEAMETEKMTFFQKSHAKYYVGVFDDYVEVLSGSFNIHKGPSFENISFRKYDKTFFRERYLHMFKDFKYSENINNPFVHYMIIGNENEENNCKNIDEIINI